jgi:hypothetical protein
VTRDLGRSSLFQGVVVDQVVQGMEPISLSIDLVLSVLESHFKRHLNLLLVHFLNSYKLMKIYLPLG